MLFIKLVISLILRNNVLRGLFHRFRKNFIKKVFVSVTDLKFRNFISIDLDKLISYFDRNPGKKNVIINAAEDFLRGHISVYQQNVNFKEYKVEEYSTFSKRLPGKDVRFVWEIYRNKIFYNLGIAYKLTGDEKIAEEVFNYINSFDNYCPMLNKSSRIPYCAMEASIRLYNLYWVSYFFSGSPNFNQIENKIKEIFQHYLNYIWTNYEIPFYGLESNHSISDAFGLILGASILPDHPMSKKWFNFGKKVILRSVKEQFYKDGVNFESSTHYHRFVFEMLMICYMILKINKIKLHPDFIKSLQKIGLSLIELTHSNQMISRVGDNDGGKLFYDFDSNKEFVTTRYLQWFNGSNDMFPETMIFEDCPELKSFLKHGNNYSLESYFVAKSNKLSLIAPCISIGTNGKGNHQHNDFLSFELYSHYPFIVDSWSYCYTGNTETRNLDRSVQKHNTICIDNREIVPFKKERLFEMLGTIKVKHKLLEKSENRCKAVISHNGYKNLSNGKQYHSREFTITNDPAEINIIDILSGQGNHTAEINFYIAKKYWNFIKNGETLIFRNELEMYTVTCDADIVEVNDAFISANFLLKEDAYLVKGVCNYLQNRTINTKIIYQKV